jgi:hypothetical protein
MYLLHVPERKVVCEKMMEKLGGKHAYERHIVTFADP